MNNMILSQPGAWSAEPSGLLPGPWNFGSLTRNIMTLVLREARKSWRCPTGGADHTRSSLLMVQMDAAPVSTAAVASSRPREDAEGPHPPWNVPGGSYRPHIPRKKPTDVSIRAPAPPAPARPPSYSLQGSGGLILLKHTKAPFSESPRGLSRHRHYRTCSVCSALCCFPWFFCFLFCCFLCSC